MKNLNYSKTILLATLFLTTLSGVMAQSAPALIYKAGLIVNKSSNSTTNASSSSTSTTANNGNTTSTSANNGNTTGSTSPGPGTTNSNRNHRDRSGSQNQGWGHHEEGNDHQAGSNDHERKHKTCDKSGNQEYSRSEGSKSGGSRGHAGKCGR